eukprot:TRINITY_DN18310_c0_g1_i1.p1 TRINITY_DN18310_c0_g1~~TRINITY_DN18310_c0_g1_i1.p1  ORF type:complete len:524 (+),score=127.76 TRINITY_DN18310_c0_g1_i1:189-1760(+)
MLKGNRVVNAVLEEHTDMNTVTAFDSGDDAPEDAKDGGFEDVVLHHPSTPSKLAWASDDDSCRPDSAAVVELKPAERHTGMFHYTDSAAMKDQVRKAILKPEAYSVFDYYHAEGVFQKVAKHAWFENVTLSVISLNAIWISIDTDYNYVGSPVDKFWFELADNLFCVYFFGEWFIRFMAFKKKFNCFRDAWFVFDSCLVLLMVLETWVLVMVVKISGGKAGGSVLANAAILRLFRLLRLSRLLRMLRSLPELMILVKGMMTAMRSVMYVMGLLIIITYVFAIAFTLLSDGTDFKADFFADVPLAMYSLIIYGTFLDNLADFCDAIRAESFVCLCLVGLFIILACLTVLNMLIGVLCEVISAVAATEREELLTVMVSDTIKKIMKQIDTNGDGMISFTEFRKILEYPSALRALQQAGVDPAGTVDFADLFFIEDGEPIQLPFDRFMEMVLDLRGSNGATVKDVMTLWKQINPRMQQTNKEVANMKETAKRMEKELKDSTARLEAQLDDVLAEVKQIARRGRQSG